MVELQHQQKILVVDDDRSHLALLDKCLSNNGYSVVVTSQADEGLQLAMRIVPDLIILDVMMPIINGYNICRLLKNDIKTARIPVLMLTSRDEEQDRRYGNEAGANAYLVKPVDVNQLLEQIRQLLSAAASDGRS